MGLLSFFRRKLNATTLTLVVYVDAGRGNCKAALMQAGETGPIVTYTVFGEQKMPNKDQLNAIPLTLSSLSLVLENIATTVRKSAGPSGRYVVERVVCLLASPYYLSHTSIVHYDGEKEFEVSPKLIGSILAKSVPDQHTEAVHGGTFLGDSPVVITQRLVDVSINGYSTAMPYGKTAQKLALSVFQTKASKEIVTGITETVKKYSSAELIIEPISLAAFIALRDHFEKEHDFVFVTIGGDVTEVSLVHNNTLLETVSFPFGRHSLSRHIGRRLSVSPEVGLSRLKLFQEGGLSSAESAQFPSILEEARAEWFSYFENSLVTLAEEIAIPNNIYIFSDKDVEKAFESFAMTPGFASQALTANGLNVRVISLEDLQHYCIIDNDARCDSILSIGTLFASALGRTSGKQSSDAPTSGQNKSTKIDSK